MVIRKRLKVMVVCGEDILERARMDYAGTISCEIDEPQILYFIIDNDDQRRADVTKFEIEYIGKRLSIVQSVFG